MKHVSAQCIFEPVTSEHELRLFSLTVQTDFLFLTKN